MSNIQFVQIVFFIMSMATIYATDQTSEPLKGDICTPFCRAYCTVDRCVFGIDGSVKIDNFTYQPAENEWHIYKKLDKVDRYIYKNVACVPYCHQDFQQVLMTRSVAVMQVKYDELYARAKMYFNQKLFDFNIMIATQLGSDQVLKKAKSRIDQYLYYLTEVDCYDHECVGAMVSHKAMICLLQGAYLYRINSNNIAT